MLAILKLYGQLAAKALPRALRGWPVALLPLVYPFVLGAAAALVAPLGLLGGLILALILCVLLSSYLHLLAAVVSGVRVTWGDFKQSFLARFNDVMSALFALWMIDLALGLVTGGMAVHQRMTIRLLVGLAMVVFFNPLPEVIYQRRVAGWFAHLGESARFVLAHWPAWLPPNLVLAGLLAAPSGVLRGPAGARVLGFASVFSVDGIAVALASIPLWLKPIMLLFIHWAMIWRGLLFHELSSGISARQRAIRDAWGR